MKPKEFEILQAAVGGSRSASWFEAPEMIETTKALVAKGLIKKVDLHKPDTGAEPRHYRATERGRALIEGVTWDAAKTLDLPEGDWPHVRDYWIEGICQERFEAGKTRHQCSRSAGHEGPHSCDCGAETKER